MTLIRQIDEDIKTAMRAREAARLSTLRMFKAALKNAQIEKGGPNADLPDADALAIARKLIKQREDSVESFEKGGRPEMAANERAEIEVLKAYMPAALEPAELAALVEEAVKQATADGKPQMGAVMKIAAAKAAGRVDGKTLSAEVQKRLK